MADESTTPVEVDQIECAPLGRAKIAVRITGRWRNRRRLPDARAFLVIEADGRRHRFPAMPEPRRPRIGRPGTWAGTFALPSSLEPHLDEEMSLWLGTVEIPLPRPAQVPRLQDVPADEQDAESANGSEPGPSEPEPRDVGLDEEPLLAQIAGGEPDPEPEELQATVAALRTELQQRASSEAQVRGALAGTQAELDGRAAHQTALEATQAELRDQLSELLALVERESEQRTEVESRAVVLAGEVAELQDRLVDLTAARERVAEETGSLKAQLERAAQETAGLGNELVQLQSAADQEGAERVLLEARIAELSTQLGGLRGELAHSEVSREAALGEAAGLRDELERLGTELSQARAAIPVDAGLSEAQALLEQARAATARLRGTG
jgi:uncharacterized coiled-coil DUF342 family protein